MSRVIIDTNVIISGLLWGGIPGEVLMRVEAKKDLMFVSRQMLSELMTVIQRPKFRLVLERAGMADTDIVFWITKHATVVIPKPLPDVVIKEDPADDRFLACAASVNADYIISGNKHLLDLGQFDRIPIITPKQYISTKEEVDNE